MVATMKKFVFLAFHRDWDQFLHDLRDLGMIHVVEHDIKNIDEESLYNLIRTKKELDEAKKVLLKSRDKRDNGLINEPVPSLGYTIPSEIAKIDSDRSILGQQLMVASKERDTLKPWGDFDPKQIELLKSAGYVINFFISPDIKFKPEWKELYDIFIVKKESSRTYFLTVSRNLNMPELLDLEEEKLPNVSLSTLNDIIESVKKKLTGLDEKLVKLSDDIPSIDAAIKELENDIQFSKVVNSGMPVADNKVILLQGWAPEDSLQAIEEYLDKGSVYYETYDPSPEDDVPIKFKNNRFSRLFEPIAKLYELPKYNEIDLTPYFAPFYMIFFGLALGDIGYGAFLLIATTLFKLIKKKSIGKTMRGTMTLVQILGASTMVCGLLQGGFFGINLYQIDNPFVKNIEDTFYKNNSQMFTLSLILGVVQIMFGKLLKIFNRIKQFGIKHAISSIGWFVFLLSIIVANLIPAYMPLGGTIHSVVMITAAVLIVFFNSPGKNILVNMGSSLWDAYNMATGLLGDILSYVRLFALGLSGGILASVFTNLATGMSPDNAIAGPIVTILIFLFGHIINIFMNTLGAFVHPLRLTFVEFYNNSEFSGGGKRFSPFAKS